MGHGQVSGEIKLLGFPRLGLWDPLPVFGVRSTCEGRRVDKLQDFHLVLVLIEEQCVLVAH